MCLFLGFEGTHRKKCYTFSNCIEFENVFKCMPRLTVSLVINKRIKVPSYVSLFPSLFQSQLQLQLDLSLAQLSPSLFSIKVELSLMYTNCIFLEVPLKVHYNFTKFLTYNGLRKYTYGQLCRSIRNIFFNLLLNKY